MPVPKRDWKYTKDVTDIVMNIWMKMPELRLGQLLDNAVGRYAEGATHAPGGPSMFYIEDDKLLEALKRMKEELGR